VPSCLQNAENEIVSLEVDIIYIMFVVIIDSNRIENFEDF